MVWMINNPVLCTDCSYYSVLLTFCFIFLGNFSVFFFTQFQHKSARLIVIHGIKIEKWCQSIVITMSNDQMAKNPPLATFDCNDTFWLIFFSLLFSFTECHAFWLIVKFKWYFTVVEPNVECTKYLRWLKSIFLDGIYWVSRSNSSYHLFTMPSQ